MAKKQKTKSENMRKEHEPIIKLGIFEKKQQCLLENLKSVVTDIKKRITDYKRLTQLN